MNSIKTFFKLTGVMILLQGVRAAIFAAGFTLFQNQIAGVYQRMLSGIAITITAVFFILVFRPDFARIGFSLKGSSRVWKIAVPILCGIWVALILSSLALSEDGSPNFGLLLENFINCVLIVCWEELVFRGYFWKKVEDSTNRLPGISSWIMTTVLFSIWHLGYFDHYWFVVRQNFPNHTLAEWIPGRLLVGLAFGVVTGGLRLWSGNIYISMVFHGIKNLFGR